MAENNKPYDLFISYSSQDHDYAHEICAALERQGIPCWIAPRNITGGTEWAAAILEGIDQSKAMMLIFSPHADASIHVRREVDRALSKGLPILPVRLEDAQPSGALEYAICNTHWVDIFPLPKHGRIPCIVDAANRLLSYAPSTCETSVAAKPAPAPPVHSWRRPLFFGVAFVCVALIALFTIVSLKNRVPVSSSPVSSSPVSVTHTPTPSDLETQLRAANIDLGDPKDTQQVERVRNWIAIPANAYQMLAQTCVEDLKGKRFKQALRLDMLDDKYTQLVGEENYAPNGKLNLKRLEEAMALTYNELYGADVKSLEEIVEARSP